MPKPKPIVTFVSAKRLPTTASGNARWIATADDGETYQVQDDAVVGSQTIYKATRYELTLTRAGRIKAAKPLDPTEHKGVVI